MTPANSIKVGDTFTMQGVYQKRTFWQWLTRQPRTLQVYQVTAVWPNEDDPDYCAFEPAA